MDLRWLFLDMNSFFASCEQQEHPELRGRPVAVAPVDSDATCCIAASYEAKAYGIKCGTNVGEARRKCPELVVVHGQHTMYADYHKQILWLLKSMLPDVRKLSVDEMACPLWAGNERTVGDAVALGRRIKRALREHVGECMICSIGLAPNVFLAKVATELHKPNGLVVLRESDLPGPLLSLGLRDFPGIGQRMLPRLHRCGIHTVRDLYTAERWLLRMAWGGVVGERWWFMLRGDTQCDYAALTESETKSVSHSHVLAPEIRNDRGAEGVLLRLTSRAVTRLRLKGLAARSIGISMRHRGEHTYDNQRWTASSERRTPASDPFTLIAAVRDLWGRRPSLGRRLPTQVSVALYNLLPKESLTLPLFDDDRRNEEAARAVDSIRIKYGKDAIELGSVFFQDHGKREAIAFGKVTDDDREDRDGIEFNLPVMDRAVTDIPKNISSLPAWVPSSAAMQAVMEVQSED